MAMTTVSPNAPATTEGKAAKPARISGNYSDTAALGAALENASARAHLVSPVNVGFSIPMLHEVTIVAIKISEAEVYPTQGGKMGLTKSALDRIAIAAGVEWDPRESRRLDDGSDPLYVEYQAVGRFPTLDGSYRTITGTKIMDLRDGSAQTRTILGAKNGEKTLSQTRTFIGEHAESKAKNRAIRSGLGLRSGYTSDELSKPFVVARLIFSGHSDDAEVRKIVAVEMVRQRFSAERQLYGGTAAPVPAAQPIPTGYAPPPVTATVDADDDIPDGTFDGAFEPPADSRFAHRGDADAADQGQF